MRASLSRSIAGRLVIYLLIIPLALLVLVPNSFETLQLISTGEIQLWPQDEPEPAPVSTQAHVASVQPTSDISAPTASPLQGLRMCGAGDPVAPAVPPQAQRVVQVYCTDRGQVVSGPPLGPWTQLDVDPTRGGDISAFLAAGAYAAIRIAPLDAATTREHARLVLEALRRETNAQEIMLAGLQPDQVGPRSLAVTLRAADGAMQSIVLLAFDPRPERPYVGIACAPACDYARPFLALNSAAGVR